MSQNQLSRIVLSGFKSIRECNLELKNLNILIGPNGAGKSSFIAFFSLIQNILEKNLQLYISKQGGPDALLHFGRKKTERLATELYFNKNGYKFTLEPTQDNRMVFTKENLCWNLKDKKNLFSGHFETKMEPSKSSNLKIYEHIMLPMKSFRLYHFHDTSESALVKQRHTINDNLYLRKDARNLAAFLYLLKNQYSSNYSHILKTIQLVAPFFKDFLLRKHPDNKDQIELEWIEKGENTIFKAHSLSDGTLRFICLATLLLQPEELKPKAILIDEPELGLHPFAINLLASLLRSNSKKRQIIISTQSPSLLNEFSCEDVIVADRKNGVTDLSRLNSDELKNWLDKYSLGELWGKNLIGGRPTK